MRATHRAVFKHCRFGLVASVGIAFDVGARAALCILDLVLNCFGDRLKTVPVDPAEEALGADSGPGNLGESVTFLRVGSVDVRAKSVVQELDEADAWMA